ncbi:MAG: tetratricopeptide repeat protein [Acidobacteria bacterium]|nr:tetratricopeptide repeat protein [Acidobacteriota bacterium]
MHCPQENRIYATRVTNCMVFLVLACLCAPAQENRRSASDRAEQAWQAYEAGQLSSARDQLRQAIDLNPAQPLFRVMLAEVAWSLKDFDAAIQQLEKAVRLDPEDFSARLILARRYQAQNRDLDALRVLAVPPPREPLLTSWRFCRGFSLFRSGRITAAKREFSALLKVPDLEAPVHFFLGGIAYRQNHFEEASLHFARAVLAGNVPGNRAFNAYTYDYGLALFKLGKYAEASAQFLQSAERFPRDPLPWMMRGRCEQKLGNYASAIQAYEESVRSNPNFEPAYYQLARLHQQYGDPRRAEALFQRVGALTQAQVDRQEANALHLKTEDAPHP